MQEPCHGCQTRRTRALHEVRHPPLPPTRRRTRPNNKVSRSPPAACARLLLTLAPEAALDASAPLLEDLADASGPIDSDEEKDAVMAAVARSRPRPAAQHVVVPLRKKYAYIRMKEMLSQALGGRGANIFGGMPAGSVSGASGGVAQAQGEGGASTETERRASVVPASARSSVSAAAGAGMPARKSSGVITAGA